MNELLAAITEQTFSRAELVYRLDVIREFLEFTYFAQGDTASIDDPIESFAELKRKPAADIAFLRSLSPTLLAQFDRNTFYAVLDQAAKELEHRKTLSLTVPVRLARADLRAIGMWARESVDQSVMLDIDIDSSIIAGCRIVWNSQLYDFSLDHYLAAHQDELHRAFEERLATPPQS